MSELASILVYHAIRSSTDDGTADVALGVDRFARQMAFLAQHREVVPLDVAVQTVAQKTRRRVAITFDDGYRSVLEHALPVLEEFRFPATVFVPTGAIGDRNRWDATSPPAGLPVMSGDESREIERRGLQVESHGHGHIDLAQATLDEIRRDLTRSMEMLCEILGRMPKFLAYPWGRVTPDVESLVEALGFQSAFTIGVRDRGRFARGRIPVRPVNPSWKFRLQTSGHWSAIRFSRAVGPIRAGVRATRAARS